MKKRTSVDALHAQLKDFDESCAKALDETLERIDAMEDEDEKVDFCTIYQDHQYHQAVNAHNFKVEPDWALRAWISKEVLKAGRKRFSTINKITEKDFKFRRVRAMNKLIKSINGVGFM